MCTPLIQAEADGCLSSRTAWATQGNYLENQVQQNPSPGRKHQFQISLKFCIAFGRMHLEEIQVHLPGVATSTCTCWLLSVLGHSSRHEHLILLHLLSMGFQACGRTIVNWEQYQRQILDGRNHDFPFRREKKNPALYIN